MRNSQIEEEASQVQAAMGEQTPPIDVLGIAREEDILLAPGAYGGEFEGRIEYHRGKGKFLLLYPQQGGTRGPSRIRFSVAHELGHYYLPEHRRLLLGGEAHYSKPGFVCDNRLEREADRFAASLLLPRETLADLLRRKAVLNLKEILDLSSDWHTSLTCAAIRYVEFASDPCAVIVSKQGQVCYYVVSDDADYRGLAALGRRTVPQSSATAEAASNEGSGRVFQKPSDTQQWFSPRRYCCDLWEEAFPLGYTGLVLTLLAFETAQ